MKIRILLKKGFRPIVQYVFQCRQRLEKLSLQKARPDLGIILDNSPAMNQDQCFYWATKD